VQIAAQEEKIQLLQDMLLATSDMLSKAQSNLSVGRHVASPEGPESRIYQNNLLQIFYNTLVENQVNEDFAREILNELDKKELVEKLDINFVVKIVYNSIVKIIGAPSALQPARSKGNPQIFAFVGPTGVGKTTTIAKLTADLSLNRSMNVGLITADTYRIAAIEQLKTYGDILGIDVSVAYRPSELKEHIEAKKAQCDIILIDTAGRSHKNEDNMRELSEFINSTDAIEKFLVLSLTTKYDDMLDIVETYSKICDFRIIFTKLDETNKIGNIANISHRTGKKLSYITFGQNVPDDIKTIAPNEVAMRLLGLGEEDGPGKQS
jgi:flagellar biosynthesis protein FlhF